MTDDDEINAQQIIHALGMSLTPDDMTAEKAVERARKRLTDPHLDVAAAARWEVAMLEAFDRWLDQEKTSGAPPSHGAKAMNVGMAQLIVAFASATAHPAYLGMLIRHLGEEIASSCDKIADRIDQPDAQRN